MGLQERASFLYEAKVANVVRQVGAQCSRLLVALTWLRAKMIALLEMLVGQVETDGHDLVKEAAGARVIFTTRRWVMWSARSVLLQSFACGPELAPCNKDSVLGGAD